MNAPETPLRAVIYSRISLDRSGEGESNDRQEEACRMLATMRGWEVVAVERDVSVSAYGDKRRDGWETVLDRMRAGTCDVVIAWKMDRITRTVAGLVDLVMLSRQTGVSLATTDGMFDLTTPTGKALATILATVAELEVELKAERQVLANKKRREDGQPWRSGFKSFGYTLAGGVIEPEAALIRQGAADFLAGKSLGQVAADWQSAGMPTRSGNPWRNTSVRTILANPRLAGFVTFGRESTGKVGKWEPILDADTHALITARLAEPGRRQGGSKRGPKAENLLTGIARCSVCEQGDDDSRPTVFGRGNDGQGRPAYRCDGSHVLTARAEAEALVLDGIEQAVETMRPGLVLSIRSEGSDSTALGLIAEENARLRELGESHGAGRIPTAVLEASSAAILARIAELEAEVDHGTAYDPRRLTDDALDNFRTLDLNGQRAVLSRIARVTLHPKGRGRKGVPMGEQVSLDVRVTEGGESRWVPVIRRAEHDRNDARGVLAQPSDSLPSLMRVRPAAVAV